jgi:hypothetical protein
MVNRWRIGCKTVALGVAAYRDAPQRLAGRS